MKKQEERKKETSCRASYFLILSFLFVLFFFSPAAEDWRANFDDAFVLDVVDAFRVAGQQQSEEQLQVA